MSEPENSSPQPPADDPKSSDKKLGKSPKKQKNSPSGNLFWYLLLSGVVLSILYYSVSESARGKKLSYSEFVSQLEKGDLNESNVYELTMGNSSLTFRNQPKKKSNYFSFNSNKDTSEDQTKDTSQGEKEEAELQFFYVPIYGMPDDSKAELSNLIREKGIHLKYASPPADFGPYLTLLFVILVTFFVFSMFRRMGPGSAMSFGRLGNKLLSQENVKTTFNDVAGIDEAVEELREVVEFLKTPARYQALGGRIPRGVLLVGPPGTGKTLLAKAVAGEAGVPFFGLSGSDFVEMYVGVGAARVRDMFQQAIQRSPSIIFIDELDALGKTRGSGMPGGHDEREQTLNALLVEMDGFSSDQSVIVMGATNRPETLDPALMRPGRFDRHVLVDKPDYKGREAILKVHSSKVKIDDTVDFRHVAKLTPGFSGADLSNLVNEAALLAARRNLTAVSMKEFEEGIERVIAGLEKSTRIISQDEKQRVAYHECGHALVATTLPHTDPVHKISIIPRGMGALGYMLQRPQDDRYLVTQSELENRISVLLGGIAAEEIIFNETSTGAQNDLQRATDTARRMVTEFGMSPKMGRVCYDSGKQSPFLENMPSSHENTHSEETMREIDTEVKRIVDHCMETSLEILRTHKDVLEHMATDLIDIEVMDARQLDEILESHKKGPQLKHGTNARNREEEGASSQSNHGADSKSVDAN